MSINKTNNGYSLIEVLIALFVFAILGVITANVISNAFVAKTTSQEKGESLNQLQLMLSIMQQDLYQIQQGKFKLDNSTYFNALLGHSNEITFVRGGNINPYGSERRSTLSRIRYAITNNEFCRYSSYNINPLNIEKDKEHKSCYLKGLQNMSFNYLNRKAAKLSDWSGFRLPNAINVSFTHSVLGKFSQFHTLPQDLVVQIKIPNKRD